MEWLAYIVGVLGVLSFFIILIGGGQPGSPRSMSIVALLSGVVKLLMEIAQNTRRQ
jgi:hypothetical protein